MTLLDYFVIGGGWILYLTVHSALATNAVKEYVALNVGLQKNNYRLMYSTISGLGLLGLIYLMALTPSLEIFSPPGYLKYFAMILASYGVIVLVTSFRHISLRSFLGVRSSEVTQLRREGIHGYVRHPIYSGTILIFIGMFLYHPTDLISLTVLVNFAYLPIGISLEEKKLLLVFGEDYRLYQSEVPSVFPFIKRGKTNDFS